MTFRNTSGKFSLSGFGRRQPSYSGGPESPGLGGPTGGGGGGTGVNGSPGGNADSNGGSGFMSSFTNFGQAGNDDREDASPRVEGGGGGGGGPGLGWTLGKKIAHQSLLPALGNQELRSLQGVITAEKGVLINTEKLATDTQKAAATLPALGAEEGPDLQDVLTHSSTLLTHLSAALTVFAGHQSNMRVCYKRIREREEDLDELRRKRRATGAKAESAEKKLAKMGPENKALASQTELLERLRVEMRQMDTDIVMEDSKLGDFKRQIVKEALSLKFGGLEELGEKMCIIGELGKLLIEEIPLEETPPGYGRAPYTGYDKTDSAVTEATRCLATVGFNGTSSTPRPPGAAVGANHLQAQAMGQQPPRPDRVAAAEEFANYPGNIASPEAKGKAREGSNVVLPSAAAAGEYRLDENPYGGYVESGGNKYQDFGGMRGNEYGSNGGGVGHGHPPIGGSEVVWQGPPEEALRAGGQHQQHGTDHHVATGEGTDRVADYEYEQQKQLDAEEAAWRDAQSQPQTQTLAQDHTSGHGVGPVPVLPELPNPHRFSHIPFQSETETQTRGDHQNGAGAGEVEAEPRKSWEPLNVKRERSDLGHGQSHAVITTDGADSVGQTSTSGTIAPEATALGPPVTTSSQQSEAAPSQDSAFTSAPGSIDLPPPNPAFRSGAAINPSTGSGLLGAQTPMEGFYTPMENPTNSTNPLESLEQLAAMEKTYSVDDTDTNPTPLQPPPPMTGHTRSAASTSGRDSPSFGGAGIGNSTPTSPTAPSAGTTGAKMSAAAFRRAAKPRTASYGPASTASQGQGQNQSIVQSPTSTEMDEGSSGPGGAGSRRLPIPPVGTGFGYGGSEPTTSDKEREAQRMSQQTFNTNRTSGGAGGDVGSIMGTTGDADDGAFEDATSLPPAYAGTGAGAGGQAKGHYENESLR